MDPTDWELRHLHASMLEARAEVEEDVFLPLADLQLGLGQRDEAIGVLERVLELDPDNVRAKNLLREAERA